MDTTTTAELFASIELHKRLGYMITPSRRPGAMTGIASALCIIRDSDNVSERAMAYMMIKNAPSAESAEIISSFFADNANKVDTFFMSLLEALVDANSYSNNQVYRSSFKKLL